MTHTVNIRKSSLARFKDIVDFIYEATAKPGGYAGSFAKHGTRTGYVAREMLNRGILKNEGTKHAPVYVWYSGAMAPTKVLYSSIAESVLVMERESAAKNKAEKKEKPAQAVEDAPKAEVVVEAVADAGVDTHLLIVEYNEKQELFHIEPIYEREDGKRFTHHGVYTSDWWPIAVIPEEEYNKKIWNAVMAFIEGNAGKGYDVGYIYEAAKTVLPEPYIYKRTRGLFVGDGSNVEEEVVLDPVDDTTIQPMNYITGFTDRELWDELKRRGWHIENDRIVKYLD